jgi:hypothetical protein
MFSRRSIRLNWESGVTSRAGRPAAPQLFSPKSERSPEDADSSQLAMFNEANEPAIVPSETEEVVAPVKHRGKRKPLPSNLPRM